MIPDHIDTTPVECLACGTETMRENIEWATMPNDEEMQLCGACAHVYNELDRNLGRVDPRDVHVNIYTGRATDDNGRQRSEVRRRMLEILEADEYIPRPVAKLAASIEHGKHPRECDFLDYDDESDDSEWHKLAACGNPTYLHKPSGYGVTLGQANTAAIEKPSQMRSDAALAESIVLAELETYGNSEFFALPADGHARDIADEYREGDRR